MGTILGVVMLAMTGSLTVAADRAATQAAATQQAVSPPPPATQPRLGATAAAGHHDPLDDLPSYGQMLRRTAYTLFAIIAALLIVAKLLPRWLGKMPLTPRGKAIEVVEFHRLEPRKGIYLIRVAGQYFLVGSTGDRLETLAGGPLDQEKIAAALGAGAGATKSKNAGAMAPGNVEVETAGEEAKRSFVEVLRGKRAGDGFES
jgi:flagellar biogenesis protein FliO